MKRLIVVFCLLAAPAFAQQPPAPASVQVTGQLAMQAQAGLEQIEVLTKENADLKAKVDALTKENADLKAKAVAPALQSPPTPSAK